MSLRVRTLCALAALCLLAAVPSLAAPAARAATPPSGMYGLTDWGWPSTATLDREAPLGLKTWRMPLDYARIGYTQGTYDFSGSDWMVSELAKRGMTPLFVLAGCPAWSCPLGGPPTSGQALTDWKAFVSAAVRRYGTGGTFWAAHPTLPQRPVTAWQVFNEVNGSGQWPNPSAAAYAAFLAATSASIRGADAQSKVILAGLPEKMTIWMKDYLASLYQQAGFKSSFDAVAIHGYTTYAGGVAAILDVARRIMIANGDSAKPVWLTEMSWATGGPPHPFVVDEATQASWLRASWDQLLACRARWNLQRVYWFGWRDRAVPTGGTDYWGYHNGLLRLDGSAKPALAASDEFLGSAPLPGGRGDTCTMPGGATIDMTVPDTSITAGPGARTASTTPSFTFAATETPVRYECHFEGAGWQTCTPGTGGTWRPSTALAQGQHWLTVRAIDPTGNVDATPAERSLIVDLTPPDTYVSGTWGNVSLTATQSLTFSSNEPVSRYECRIDSGAWSTCATPYSTKLPAGAHTISVRAVDLAGWADPNPAVPWYQVN